VPALFKSRLNVVNTSQDNDKTRLVKEITEYPFALHKGHKLQSFIIESVLGSGGFGTTYLARHQYLPNEWAAIKEYYPAGAAIREANSSVRLVSKSQEDIYAWGLKRFLDEARILSNFKHPHIVGVRDFFEENNTAYMVMDYVRGRSINEVVEKEGTFDEKRLRELIYPLLDALELVHSENVLHRDITPSNVLLRADSSPVLIDFGSARYAMLSRGSAHHPQPVKSQLTAVYTSGYAPLEQYEQTAQGPWTDIYALGATVYYAAFKKRPLDVLFRSGEIRINKRDPLKSAHMMGKGKFSTKFLKAIDRALRVKAAKRPQSIEEWRTLFGPSPQHEAESHQSKPPAELTVRSQSLKARVWALALIVSVLAIVALLIWVFSLNSPIEHIMSQASNTLVENPLDATALEKARDLYLEALSDNPNNRQAYAGYNATQVLLTFKFALDNGKLKEATHSLQRAEEYLQQAGADKAVMERAQNKLYVSKWLRQASDIIIDTVVRQPLAPNTWERTSRLFEKVLTIEPEEPHAQAGLSALKSLKAARAALEHEEFDQTKHHIETAQTQMAELGIHNPLARAHQQLASARTAWEAARQQQIAQRLQSTLDYFSGVPLTDQNLTEGRAAYRKVLELEPGQPEAIAGLTTLEALSTLLEAIHHKDFSGGERVLAEAQRQSPEALRNTGVLEAARKQLVQARIQELLQEAAAALRKDPLSEAMLDTAERLYREVYELQAQHGSAMAGLEVVINLRAAKAQIDREQFPQAQDSLGEIESRLPEAALGNALLEDAKLKITQAEADWNERHTHTEIARLSGEARTVWAGDWMSESTLNTAAKHYRAILALQANHPEAEAGLQMVEYLRKALAARQTRDFETVRKMLDQTRVVVPAAGLDVADLEKVRTQVNTDEQRWRETRKRIEISRWLAKAVGAIHRAPFSEQAWARAAELFEQVLTHEPEEPHAQAGLSVLNSLKAARAALEHDEFDQAKHHIETAQTQFTKTLGVRGVLVKAHELVETRKADAVRDFINLAIESLEAEPLSDDALHTAKSAFHSAIGLDTDEPFAVAGHEIVSAILAARQAIGRREYALANTLLDQAQERLASIRVEDTILQVVSSAVNRIREEWIVTKPSPSQIIPLIGDATTLIWGNPLDESTLESAEKLYRNVLARQADQPNALVGLDAVRYLKETAVALERGRPSDAENALKQAEGCFQKMGITTQIVDRAWQVVNNAQATAISP
jgi:serine/threonine protein kinase